MKKNIIGIILASLALIYLAGYLYLVVPAINTLSRIMPRGFAILLITSATVFLAASCIKLIADNCNRLLRRRAMQNHAV